MPVRREYLEMRCCIQTEGGSRSRPIQRSVNGSHRNLKKQMTEENMLNGSLAVIKKRHVIRLMTEIRSLNIWRKSMACLYAIVCCAHTHRVR